MHKTALMVGLILVLAGCGTTDGDAGADDSTTSTTAATTSTTGAQTTTTVGETTTTEAETTTTTEAGGEGLLVIAAVDFDAGTYTVRNDGNGDLDLTGFWACNRPSYSELPGEVLAPGESLDISTGGLSLSATSGELGIYNSNAFSSSSAIQAYVQWGSDSHGRTDTAVSGGAWTAGEFVDNGGAAIVSSGSNPITAADWSTG